MSNTITTINPTYGNTLMTYSLMDDQEAHDVIQLVDADQKQWRHIPIDERSRYLFKVAEVLQQNKSRYAQMMTDEMGKVLSDSIAEIDKCAWVCRYYAENTSRFLQDECVDTDAQKSYVSFQPLGTVLAVMPWNYPFWQVFRFAAPALMAGNGAVLKHASNVPGCGLLIEEVFREAGLPTDLFRFLLISSSQVADVIKNPIVKACTLTGSEAAGISVASSAAKELKKSVLELGGSDPYIVLEDADIELAAEQCAISRLLNAGQSCIGAKRFIILETVYEEWLTKFTNHMKSAIMGAPNQSSTTLGPLARIDLRDELHDQVLRSIEAGANLHLGGYIPEEKGAYYPPTILTNVISGMPAYAEELFGPVASVIQVKDEAEAIKIANDTAFGLGACIFSKDTARAERIARDELQAGCCFVNQFVKSDPRLPFGGIKNSGFGRELSHYGIKEFVNIKTIYVK